MGYNQEEIESNAAKYGYKTANLMHLRQEVESPLLDEVPEETTQKPPIRTAIPQFEGVDHDTIMAHLKHHNSLWRDHWDKFVAIQQEEDSKVLSQDSKAALSAVREEIIRCFKQDPLSTEHFSTLKKSLKDKDLVMVRSTGREDSTELSNPGGNDSDPCEAQNIGSKVGKIVASYFGERSLQQRLDANDNVTAEPFCPILIQSMVREIPKTADSSGKMVASGVIYSGESTRIQAAPGHGELVVNSKGNVDNYYVTADNMVYGEVKAKHDRMVAQWNGDSIDLVSASNDVNLKYKSCLDEEAVMHLHALSNQIQDLYGMRMDMEFVYDESKRTVYLVQARSINQGKRQDLMPSSVSPDYIQELKQSNKIGSGQVITPDINTAVVIDDPKDIIIRQTIGEALEKYQKSEEKPSAVIVQKEAPDTSHEAGEFSKNGVVVLQLDNIRDVEKYFDNKEALIIDLQRKTAFHIAEDKDPHSFIKEGIFSSSLSSHVTPGRTIDAPGQAEEYTFIETIVSDIQQEKLGDIVQQARQGDKQSSNALFSFLYQIIANEPRSDQPIDKCLEQLSTPNYEGNNDEQKSALAKSLRTCVKHYQKGNINREVFQQTLISGGEVFSLLDRMGNSTKGVDGWEESKGEPEKKDKVDSLSYLNSLEKFTGLIRSTPKKDTLSQSVVTNIMEKRHEDKVMEGVQLDGQGKEYYLQTTKLSKFLIKEDNREHWRQFCEDICSDSDNAVRLGGIVGMVVKNNIHEQWLNVVFTEAHKECEGDSTKIFGSLASSIPDMTKFDKVSSQLQKMESQIATWGEPQNFDKLYGGLKESLSVINSNLEYDPEAPIMDRIMTRQQADDLIDVMDKTIKKVGKSTMYTDESQQGMHAKALIGEFFDVMKKWSEYTEFYDRKHIVKKMEECFNSKQPPFTEHDLSPSVGFSVSSATIDAPGTDRGFDLGFRIQEEGKTMHDLSLEDFFTTVHQNLIICVGEVFKEDSKILKDQTPELVATICDNFEKGIIVQGSNRCQFMRCELDYPDQTLYYNVPVRDHALSIAVKYSAKNEDEGVSISCCFSGANEGSRWNQAEGEAYHMDISHDLGFSKKPYFSEDKNIFSFESVLKTEEQVAHLMSSINNIIDISFGVNDISRGGFTNYIDNDWNISDLIDMDPQKIKKVTDYVCTISGKVNKNNKMNVDLMRLHVGDGEGINDLITNGDYSFFEEGYKRFGGANFYKAVFDKWKDQIDLDYRKEEGSLSVLEIIAQIGIKDDIKGQDNSYIFKAAENGNVLLVGLLESKAVVSSTSEGLTPFSILVKNGQDHMEELLELCQSCKIDMKTTNQNGTTAISCLNSDSDNYLSNYLALSKFVKPSEKDQEILLKNTMKMIEEGNREEDVIKMVEQGVNIKLEVNGKTIETLTSGWDKDWKDKLQIAYMPYNDLNPDVRDHNIELVSKAVVAAAARSYETFSSKAKDKIQELTPKVEEAFNEKYGFDMKQMREDINMIGRSLEGEYVLRSNDKIKELGKSLIEQIGVKKSRYSSKKKTINMENLEEFKFDIDQGLDIKDNSAAR